LLPTVNLLVVGNGDTQLENNPVSSFRQYRISCEEYKKSFAGGAQTGLSSKKRGSTERSTNPCFMADTNSAWYGPAYDETSNRGVLTVEAYFKAALEGSRHENRQELADIGIPFFQDQLRELYGISAPEDRIKVRFEREAPAQSPSAAIQVDFREMTYRGKEVSARALPSRTIPLDDETREYDPDYDDASSEEEESDGWGPDDDEVSRWSLWGTMKYESCFRRDT
jgi:hypothetical protein